MKKRRLLSELTLPEMKRLREEGNTNKDIAKILDLSYATVLKYLGKQPYGLESLSVFNPPDSKKFIKDTETTKEIIIPASSLNGIKLLSEEFKSKNFFFSIDYKEELISLGENRAGTLLMQIDELIELYQTLHKLIPYINNRLLLDREKEEC